MTPSHWERLSSLINQTNYHNVLSNSLKKLGLFAVLTAIIVSSCTKPEETLGENLQPLEDLLNAEVTDSISIIAVTEKIDSLRTDLFANVMAGNYLDPVFGVVKTRAVMQFSPDLSYTTLPDDFDVYSVVLSLAYQNEAYGNNTPMYFNVNELQERIYLDSSYYTNSLPAHDTQNLILPGQELQETRAEYASPITNSAIEYLNLPLKVDIGERMLAVDSLLDSFSDFADYFYGLIISSQTIDGRILSFNSIDSKITVHFRYEEDRVTKIGAYTFAYSSSCEAFTVVDHQYFGTSISALSSELPVSSQALGYLQSAGGTRIKLNIGDLRWLAVHQGLIVNKAELVLPFDSDDKLAEIDSLSLVYEVEPDAFALLRDYYRNPGGNFRKAEGYYRFNITSHVQSMINGEITNDEVLIVTRPRFSGYYNSMGARRSILHGPEFNTSDPTQNMRIVITYSY